MRPVIKETSAEDEARKEGRKRTINRPTGGVIRRKTNSCRQHATSIDEIVTQRILYPTAVFFAGIVGCLKTLEESRVNMRSKKRIPRR